MNDDLIPGLTVHRGTAAHPPYMIARTAVAATKATEDGAHDVWFAWSLPDHTSPDVSECSGCLSMASDTVEAAYSDRDPIGATTKYHRTDGSHRVTVHRLFDLNSRKPAAPEPTDLPDHYVALVLPSGPADVAGHGIEISHAGALCILDDRGEITEAFASGSWRSAHVINKEATS